MWLDISIATLYPKDVLSSSNVFIFFLIFLKLILEVFYHLWKIFEIQDGKHFYYGVVEAWYDIMIDMWLSYLQ